MVRVGKPGGSLEPILDSTIDSRGRTTIPKAVREALDLRGGDLIRYVVEGGEARVLPRRSVARLRGIVPHDGPSLSLEDMDCAIGEKARRS